MRVESLFPDAVSEIAAALSFLCFKSSKPTSNLNPGQDTREQATKRTHERRHESTQEGTHQRKTNQPTNQPHARNHGQPTPPVTIVTDLSTGTDPHRHNCNEHTRLTSPPGRRRCTTAAVRLYPAPGAPDEGFLRRPSRTNLTQILTKSKW